VGGAAKAAGPDHGDRACYSGAETAGQIRARRNRAVSTTTATKPLGVGDAAPDFTLKTIGLKEVKLRDYRGRHVVILFYPLDWTPG